MLTDENIGVNMLMLLQLLRTLNVEQQELFLELFSDLEFELDEMGYRGNETELVNDLLEAHFDISIEDERQLQAITNAVLDKTKLQAAISTTKLLH